MSDHRRPWLEEYESYGVAETLEPYPDIPVHDFLYTTAEEHPSQGIVQLGRTITYEELRDDVDALAAALQERGIEKGSRVATVLPTSVQFVLASYATSRAGGVHIPNDFLDADEDLIYRLETGNPDVLIGRNEHRELLERLREAADVEHLILTDLEDYSAEPPTHDEADGVEWLTDVIADAGEPAPVEIDPAEDVHTILFTGGTTGRPKGCLLTHRNLVANAKQTLSGQERLGQILRGNAATVMALPMYHSYGYSVTNSLVEMGITILAVPDGRDTDTMREMVTEHQPMLMFGVPTQFMGLLEEELEHGVIGLSGSAPLASETQRRFNEQSTGITQGYGLSEMSPVTHFNFGGIRDAIMGQVDESEFDQPTIGVPVPDTQVKLIDVDTREELSLTEALENGREGEMWLNGPQRMAGYLDGSDPFDEEGFVPTGDVVRLDDRGRFYVVDRVKNMINVSGLKVYTNEVDDVLYELGGVRRPATVGIPDPDRPGSERVKVFIEPEPDAELTEEDVTSFLDGRVPRQAMPREVEIIDEIPLTNVGKTDRNALDELHE